MQGVLGTMATASMNPAWLTRRCCCCSVVCCSPCALGALAGRLHAILQALSQQNRLLWLVEEGEDWLQLKTKLLNYFGFFLNNLTPEDTDIEAGWACQMWVFSGHTGEVCCSQTFHQQQRMWRNECKDNKCLQMNRLVSFFWHRIFTANSGHREKMSIFVMFYIPFSSRAHWTNKREKKILW